MAVDPGLIDPVPVIWQLVDSSTIGGIESHIAALAEALRASGQDCRIVLLDRHGHNPWLKQLRARGLPYRELGGGLQGLQAALTQELPGLVHTHGYKAGILGRFAARRSGVPVVSTFHAGERGAFPVSLYQRLDEWSSCLGARIAVDHAIARHLPFGAQVIRNFISLPERAISPAPVMSVGFVGRMSYEKGPDLFCAIAERCNPCLPFHIFGDGEMRAELEIRYGRRVTFHGLEADMSAHWPEIGLLLMPSRAEGMPMAALEALASGIPVAASRVGALPDLIGPGKTGWIFDAGDVDGAAKAVADWAALPTDGRQALSMACRDIAQARFGPDEPVASICAIYDRLMAKTPYFA